MLKQANRLVRLFIFAENFSIGKGAHTLHTGQRSFPSATFFSSQSFSAERFPFGL